MKEYVKEHSLGEFFRNSIEIYFAHLPAILGAYLIVVPLNVAQVFATANGNTKLAWLCIFANLPVALIAYGVVVVSISEACLGSKPSVMRSFGYVRNGVLGSLAKTSLLQSLALILGFIALVIPGLVFVIWFAFAPIIVVLERRAGRDSMKRSKQLAAGYHLRTAGVILLWMLAFGVVGGVGGAILGGIGVSATALTLIYTLVVLAIQPMLLVTLTLVYYDLRVRKEGYNTAGLAEDLAR